MRSTAFVIFRDKKKQWRWHLLAGNGKIVADSSEAYTRKHEVMKAVARVKVCAISATIEFV